jgi:hypothetical protein
MANLIRKLKKGIGKYKGMLPLKCFNCGSIGHFASKCPHKNKYSDVEEFSKRKNKYQKGNKGRNKKKFFKKRFNVSKEDSSSSDEKDNDSDSDSERVLFMEVEDDSEEEGKFDLIAKLISALKELRKEIKKNKSLKVELKMKE